MNLIQRYNLIQDMSTFFCRNPLGPDLRTIVQRRPDFSLEKKGRGDYNVFAWLCFVFRPPRNRQSRTVSGPEGSSTKGSCLCRGSIPGGKRSQVFFVFPQPFLDIVSNGIIFLSKPHCTRARCNDSHVITDSFLFRKTVYIHVAFIWKTVRSWHWQGNMKRRPPRQPLKR